jgi:hypothetical protein
LLNPALDRVDDAGVLLEHDIGTITGRDRGPVEVASPRRRSREEEERQRRGTEADEHQQGQKLRREGHG